MFAQTVQIILVQFRAGLKTGGNHLCRGPRAPPLIDVDVIPSRGVRHIRQRAAHGFHAARRIVFLDPVETAIVLKYAYAKRAHNLCSLPLPIGGINFEIARNLGFPPLAIGQQLVLVVIQLFAGLGAEFEIRTFHDGIHRARLLAEAAIDALGHIDVVTGCAAAAVLTRFGIDGDGLRRADRFAQFARDAAFFAIGVTAQRVLPPEARRQRPLFMRIVQRGLGGEKVLHPQLHPHPEVVQQEVFGGTSIIDLCHLSPPAGLGSGSYRPRPASPAPRRHCRYQSSCHRYPG
mmetsp:Transcript_18462/g.30090  ORF Transcript_18462/g.30090 Transcript_18462/m.30090 type:complete len:290 (-) Transcript_18462:3203-4072(-)